MIEIENINPEDKFGKEYFEHSIFNQLKYYSDFYDSLSFSIMGFISMGTSGIINMDTYAYSSIKGTIESIKDILKKGRINDAYALLRKFYDSTIINVYTNLYLQDNFDIDNFIVAQIDNWRKGSETIPEYRKISKYIKDSPKLSIINNLLLRDDRYKKIRDRCNDHTHYNFYQNYLLNDNEIYNPDRTKYLTVFAKDIEAIFIQHLAYIFYLNDHYMVSSDYMDCMELGIQPEEDSQYWVAPFIQETFDIIKAKRYDIAEEIKKNTMMQLVL
jgi:hypothetical protein